MAIPSLKNDRLLRALAKQPVDRTPIWIMRQAGRYLPEYRAIRKQVPDFMNLCRNSDLATEVTLQPISRFPLDAAILFSDILTIPDAMGLGVYFEAGEGPKLRKPIVKSTISSLQLPNIADELSYVFNTIKKINVELNQSIPLLGFSGSPWTLACYMIEGGSSKNFSKIKQMMFDAPEALDELLNILAEAVTDYLQQQIAAGVHAVQIFDTWGSILDPINYNKFSLRYIENIVNNLKKSNPETPIILFTKHANSLLKFIVNLNLDAISLDWTCDLATARELIAGKMALQGNLDPCVLHASKSSIVAEATKILQVFNGDNGHIFNLGHGIHPEVSPDKVAVLVDTVHKVSAEIISKKKGSF
jgi:uroporphyrinogen decarboxylase